MIRTKSPVPCIAMLLITPALTAAPALAQNVFDDFSSGNDNAWTRIDSPGLALGLPSTYSVEGGGYRLRGPVYPNNGFIYPTASVRADGAAADSQISVDVVNWNTDVHLVAAIGARVQQPSPSAFQF
jgi:hypothetical protein